MVNLSFSGDDGISCESISSVKLVFDVFVGDGGNVASALKLSSYSFVPLLLVPFSNFVHSLVVCSLSSSSSSSSSLDPLSESSTMSSSISLSSGDSSIRSRESLGGNGGNGRSAFRISSPFSELLFRTFTSSSSLSFVGIVGSGFCY